MKRDGERGTTVNADSRAATLHQVGGALALDFCNTTSGRGMAVHLDHLADYGDFVHWCRHAGVITDEGVASLMGWAERAPAAAQAALDRTLAVRGVLHQVFDAVAHDVPPPPRALEQLNGLLAEAARGARLVPDGEGFSWQHADPAERLDGPLDPILRSAAFLLTKADLDRLRACPGQNCGWVFLDTTKNGKRVWCDMAVCGSRAKANRRYKKLKEAGEA